MSSAPLTENDLCYKDANEEDIPTVISAITGLGTDPTIGEDVTAWESAVDNVYHADSSSINVKAVTDDFTELLIETTDGHAIPLSVGLENVTAEFLESLETLYLKVTKVGYQYDATMQYVTQNFYLPIAVKDTSITEGKAYVSGLLELADALEAVTDAEHLITALWDIQLTVEGVYHKVENEYVKYDMLNETDILPNIEIFEDE